MKWETNELEFVSGESVVITLVIPSVGIITGESMKSLCFHDYNIAQLRACKSF